MVWYDIEFAFVGIVDGVGPCYPVIIGERGAGAGPVGVLVVSCEDMGAGGTLAAAVAVSSLSTAISGQAWFAVSENSHKFSFFR